jgi:hypothetical protein
MKELNTSIHCFQAILYHCYSLCLNITYHISSSLREHKSFNRGKNLSVSELLCDRFHGCEKGLEVIPLRKYLWQNELSRYAYL